MNVYEVLIHACDADIRAGQSENVVRRLGKLNTAKVPRLHRLGLASVCRRAGLYTLGLTLLARVVHPKTSKLQASASAAEIAEYGVLLLRAGALSEALLTLTRVDAQVVPEALLYRAFCHFSSFDFEVAVPLLVRHLELLPPSYARLVGEVNLAFALVGSGRVDEADDALGKLIESAARQGHARLQSNCHAMRARIYLGRTELARAGIEVERALELIGTASTNDRLFVLKWKAFLTGLHSRDVAPIREFKQMAFENGDWDGLREADLYELKIDFKKPLFEHLVFGTPFKAYREKICVELGVEPVSEFYDWGGGSTNVFDLSTGRLDGKPLLKPGGKFHQTLDAFLRDFYRPFSVVGLFSELFPGEFFDVFTSPNRVHQQVRRMRQWLASAKLPAIITNAAGFYSLQVKGDIGFRIPLERDRMEIMAFHFQRLAAAYEPEKQFSAREARELLGFSRTSFQRLVNWAERTGKLVKAGSRNVTVYWIQAGASQNEAPSAGAQGRRAS